MSEPIFALTSAPPVFSFLLKELVNILTCLVVGSQPHSPLVAGGPPYLLLFLAVSNSHHYGHSPGPHGASFQYPLANMLSFFTLSAFSKVCLPSFWPQTYGQPSAAGEITKPCRCVPIKIPSPLSALLNNPFTSLVSCCPCPTETVH